MSVLIGVDQGTSGTRTVAFDLELRQVAEAYRPSEVSHPQPGWIEKDAGQMVATVAESVAEVVDAAGGPDQVAAIGLDNEGESVAAWHAESLQPLAPVVVWGSRVSQPVVERLGAAGFGDEIESLAGLPLDPYFSATKVRWLVESVPAVAEAAAAGSLRVGTLDAYLCARLGSGPRTDPSTAARTQLQALASPGDWDARLLELHGISRDWLPTVGPSVGELGELCGLPLRAMLVDQTASLAGHGCVTDGMAKATYGTGIFLLQNAGGLPPVDLRGLLPCVAWGDAGQVAYARDGGVFSAGTVISWLRDGLGAFDEAAASGPLAESVPDTGGVRFLPALAGLGAPWWRSEARAVISGVTSGTTRAHIVRAALDSLAFRVRDVVDALPQRPDVLRVDGGLTANGYLMQRQADVLELPVLIASQPETTALGAAAFAGVGAGLLSMDDLARLTGGGRVVEPGSPAAVARAGSDYRAWRRFAEGAAAL